MRTTLVYQSDPKVTEKHKEFLANHSNGIGPECRCALARVYDAACRFSRAGHFPQGATALWRLIRVVEEGLQLQAYELLVLQLSEASSSYVTPQFGMWL